MERDFTCFKFLILVNFKMQGVLKLKHMAMAEDTRPIDPTCACMVCL